jgi:pantoate--beta-alanine ligase
MLPTVSTIFDLRTKLLAYRQAGETVAFVPTMGALHNGHMALVAAARRVAKRCVVSIFVNPLQFGPHEDFSTYPRQLEDDQKTLSLAGCDLLYAPQPENMYPQGFSIRLNPGPLGDVLEGAFRPGFFTGVSTVVTKLLLQLLPDAALFGEKDFQQLMIIRSVTRDLDIPVHILGVPTVRDDDGLALSSRNVYLSVDERRRAVALPNTLKNTAENLLKGLAVEDVLAQGRVALKEAGFTVDYLELADTTTLLPLRGKPQGIGWAGARLLVAARIGNTRLIDNVPIKAPG